MKKTLPILLAVLLTIHGRADTEHVDGLTWTYTKSGGKATITRVSQCEGNVVVPQTLGGCEVVALADSSLSSRNMTSVQLPETIKSIGPGAFIYCKQLESINLPDSVTSIGKSAFQECVSLVELTIPPQVTSLSYNTFMKCHSLQKVVFPRNFSAFTGLDYWGEFQECSNAKLYFLGEAPENIDSRWSYVSDVEAVYWTRPCGVSWLAKKMLYKFGGFIDEEETVVDVVSSSVRENDPTVLDVEFVVSSRKPTARVRVLAFEDGIRSFAKVVRPETFVDGTEPANWDAVQTGVTNRISWRVSSDWTTRLAKMKFEVLAAGESLLPLELIEIPASDSYGKMEISWNAMSKNRWFDALLWLYADNESGLELSNGVLKNGTTQLASGTGVSAVNAAQYVYSKMGFSLLSGNVLTYANGETRLGLSPDGVRQYGYKIVED